MPFGFTNVPSTFMHLINQIRRSFISKFLVVYFNDILINNRKCSDNLRHLEVLLNIIRKEGLYANLKKCTFFTSQLIFLGFVVRKQGRKVDEEMIKFIREWPIPTTIGNVRIFHGIPPSLC